MVRPCHEISSTSSTAPIRSRDGRQTQPGEGTGLQRRPDRSVRAEGDAVRFGAGCRQVVQLDDAFGRDGADAVPAPLGERHLAVAAGGDAVRSAGAVGQRELHDRAVGGDPPDLAGGDLHEPHGAVVAGGDTGAGAPVGSGWTVTAPSMPIRPIAFAWFRANHIPPSAPAVIAEGNEPVPGSGNSVTWPSEVIRPMRSAAVSVNHSAPSGPVVTAYGPLPASATTYSRMTTAVMRCAPVRRCRLRPTDATSFRDTTEGR